MKEKAEYKDYRDYFKDLFLEKKKVNKIYSYQYCALKLKVSGSYLKLVFKKSRHISLEKLSVLSTFFGLTLFEKQWITHLFLYNTCEERELKKYFKTIVSSCLSYQSPTRQKTDELLTKKQENEIFSNWLLMAVYNSIGVTGFEWDAGWLFERLLKFESIQKQDVKNSMKKLIELKFVTVSEEGIAKKNLSEDHKHIYPWDLEEFSRFKLGHIKSAQAVDLLLKVEMPSPGRFQMSAFHVNEKEILDICQMYDELENKIRMIALSSVEPTRVLMTSNNLFSLTKKSEKVGVSESNQ